MSNDRARALAPDLAIPYLGFGTYLIPDGEAAAAVSEAIRLGYRHDIGHRRSAIRPRWPEGVFAAT